MGNWETVKDLTFKTGKYLPQADNLGQTGDDRDIYHLANKLVRAVSENVSEHPCHKGCRHCCCNNPFRILEAEWEAIKKYVKAQPPEFAEKILATANEMAEAFKGDVEAIAQKWTESQVIQEVHNTMLCPFLDPKAGTCKIYPVRPLSCRCHGYFVNIGEDHQAYTYGCQLIMDTFQRMSKHGENWMLPLMVPFKARIMELKPQQKEVAMLLWILIDGF